MVRRTPYREPDGRWLAIVGGLAIALATLIVWSFEETRELPSDCPPNGDCTAPETLTYVAPETVALASVVLAGVGFAFAVWYVGWTREFTRVAAVLAAGAGLATIFLYTLPYSTFPATVLFSVAGVVLVVSAVIGRQADLDALDQRGDDGAAVE